MNRPPFLLLALYAFLAAVLFPYLCWYVNNPDTFQYLMITRHYLEGDFREAINGYWSPLLSWLMLPFTGQDFGDIPALKTLQLVIGAGVLWTWTSVLRRSVMPEPYAEALSYAALPFVLAYAFLSPTADLLFLWLTLALFRFLAKGSALTDEQNAKRFALLGALAYYAKAFGLPLFLFLLVSEWWQVRKLAVGRRLLLRALGIFLLLIAPWVTAISLKYGHFTISEAAAFNRSPGVAPMPGQVMQLPVLSNELTKPSGPHAICAWEEPMQLFWTGRVSEPTCVVPGFLQVLERNLLTIWYFDFQRTTGWGLLLLLALFLIFRNKLQLRQEPLSQRSRLLAGLFLLAFYGGYSLILVHTRYIWISTWMMLFLAAFFAAAIEQGGRPWFYLARVLFLITLLVAIKRPVKELLFGNDRDVPAIWIWKAVRQPLQTMDVLYQQDRQLQEATYYLRSLKLLDGPIASRYSESPDRHRYSSSLFVAYHNKTPYRGQINDRQAGALEVIRESGAKYFLLWHEPDTTWQGAFPLFQSGELKVFPVPSGP